jgi:hypothetical protein
MKVLLIILINLSIYSQVQNLNGYWELVDYEDRKARYKVTYGSEGAYSDGLFFSDSTVNFLANIHFSNILSDKKTRTKEYRKKFSNNFVNKRVYKIIDNKLYISLNGNDLSTGLLILKLSKDTLILRNEELDYEHIYQHRDYSELKPIKFNKITFSTSYCLGDCPVYKLEIDSTGYLKFEGIDHILFLGKYECQLSDSIFNDIKEIINIVHWQKLDDDYLGLTHGPVLKTEVYFNDTLYKKIKDHTGPVPCEVLWLYSYFKKLSVLPYLKKAFENNIFGDKNLKIRRISQNRSFDKYNILDYDDNDFILSELLKTSIVTNSFMTRYFIDAFQLKWDDKSNSLVEIDAGIIETDGKYFKFNSDVYEYKGEKLSEYMEALIEE